MARKVGAGRSRASGAFWNDEPAYIERLVAELRLARGLAGRTGVRGGSSSRLIVNMASTGKLGERMWPGRWTVGEGGGEKRGNGAERGPAVRGDDSRSSVAGRSQSESAWVRPSGAERESAGGEPLRRGGTGMLSVGAVGVNTSPPATELLLLWRARRLRARRPEGWPTAAATAEGDVAVTGLVGGAVTVRGCCGRLRGDDCCDFGGAGDSESEEETIAGGAWDALRLCLRLSRPRGRAAVTAAGSTGVCRSSSSGLLG